MSFNDMALMMLKEYNSDAGQQQVKGILDLICLATFMSERGLMSLSERLTKFVNHIEELAPQCHVYARSEGSKIEYLRKSVMGYEWSKNAIQNIVSSSYSFNEFVRALHEGLQLETELGLVSQPISIGVVAAETLFQHYDRNPCHVVKHHPGSFVPKDQGTRTSTDSFEESRRRGVCYRCREQ